MQPNPAIVLPKLRSGGFRIFGDENEDAIHFVCESLGDSLIRPHSIPTASSQILMTGRVVKDDFCGLEEATAATSVPTTARL